jgi:hypothetical protein
MIDATPEIGFDDIVRHRAYALWESEGRPFGRDAEHWRASEEMTRAEIASAPAPKKAPRKSAPRSKASAPPKRAAAFAMSAAH